MRHVSLLLGMLALVSTGCAASGATPSQSRAGADTYDQFRTGYCAAWVHLLVAVGNPDTASGSDMTRSLEASIKANDRAAVSGAADRIRAELENGRVDVAYAAGWKPASGIMVQFDRLFAAFEASIEAEAKSAPLGVQAAKDAGQQALIGTGGGDAWDRLLDQKENAALRSAMPAGAVTRQCPGVPVSI